MARIAAVLIVGVLVLLYSASLGHPLLFDEENVIVRNPLIRSFDNLPNIFSSGFFQLETGHRGEFIEYYRPLTVTTFLIDHKLWGVDVMGFNASSLFFHILLALAYFVLVRRIFVQTPAAIFAALLYAVHPIHTEALGHVSCRSETLAALALCAALISHLSGRRLLSAMAVLAGVLCKESSVLIPFFVLAADLSFMKGSLRDRFHRSWPAWSIALAYALIRAAGFPSALPASGDSAVGMALRVFSMAGAFGRYFATLFFPPFFQLFGSTTAATTLSDPRLILTSALYAAALAAGWRAWVAGKRTAFFAQTLFWGGFIPYVQLRHFYPEWAEHYLTIPAMGFCLIAGIFFSHSLSHKRALVRIGAAATAVVWLAALGVRTYQRNLLYNDLDRYYRTLSDSASPYAVHGLQELAKLRLSEKRFDEAQAILRRALDRPLNQDVTYSLLGTSLALAGRPEEALQAYREALRRDGANAAYAREAGGILVRLGRPMEAADLYRETLRWNPLDYQTVRLGMAALEMAQDPDRARQWGEISMDRMKGMRFEQAALAVALIRLAYRQGWTDRISSDLPRFAETYREVPWHGLVLNFWNKNLSPSDFRFVAQRRFPDFADEAKGMVLNGAGIRQEPGLWEELRSQDPSFLARWEQKDPLCAREARSAVS